MEIDNDIFGCLSPIEGSLISYFAGKCDFGMVNIGCYKGRSLKYMLDGIHSFKRPEIYSIDIKIRDECKLVDRYNQVIFLQGFSNDAKIIHQIGKVDFVFIDGGHSYDECLEDLNNYWNKLVSGGIIMVHDYYETGDGILHNLGVSKACNEFYEIHKNEFVPDDWNCSPIHRVDSSWIVQRK